MSKTVLLCSGGLDSLVLSDWLLQAGRYNEVIHYFVDYGQPVASQERRASKAQAVRRDQMFVEDVLPLRAVNFEAAGPNYIPNRNAILVAMAANLAAAEGAGSVHYGATAEDYDSYPDCRPSYVSLISHLTEAGAGVRVKTPFATIDRGDILRIAAELGSEVGESWSCYVASGNEQCGECASCRQGGQR